MEKDWPHGVDFRMAPFQIDGNIGIPGVINEMLLQSQQSSYEQSRLILLPALPERWKQSGGHICGLLARGGILCDLYWNQEGGYANLRSDKEQKAELTLGDDMFFSDGNKKKQVIVYGELQNHISVFT